MLLKTMLANCIKLRKQGSKEQDFFSIYSHPWNSKLGNTFNGLTMQSVAQTKLRPTQVNEGAEPCVYHFQSFQATWIFSKKAQLGLNWRHVDAMP